MRASGKNIEGGTGDLRILAVSYSPASITMQLTLKKKKKQGEK